MAADSFSPRAQEPDEPGRLRALGIAAFLMLATAFLYQAMDGVQRANELAERRQRIAQSACRSCAAGEDDSQYADDADVTAAAGDTAADAAAAATLPVAPVISTTPIATTEPTRPTPVIPVLAPAGKP